MEISQLFKKMKKNYKLTLSLTDTEIIFLKSLDLMRANPYQQEFRGEIMSLADIGLITLTLSYVFMTESGRQILKQI